MWLLHRPSLCASGFGRDLERIPLVREKNPGVLEENKHLRERTSSLIVIPPILFFVE